MRALLAAAFLAFLLIGCASTRSVTCAEQVQITRRACRDRASSVLSRGGSGEEARAVIRACMREHSADLCVE
jgi:hypothetical protein